MLPLRPSIESERKDMDSLAVFDMVASVNVDQVAELCDPVHLDTTLLHIVRTEADRNRISMLVPKDNQEIKGTSVHFLTRTMIVSPRKSERVNVGEYHIENIENNM